MQDKLPCLRPHDPSAHPPTPTQDNLRGLWRPGAARFATELAGAVDRVNYNQDIQTMNALAALVSYLPAADARLLSVAAGNAALPAALIEKGAREGWAALKTGVAVREAARGGDGRYTLNTTAGQCARARAAPLLPLVPCCATPEPAAACTHALPHTPQAPRAPLTLCSLPRPSRPPGCA